MIRIFVNPKFSPILIIGRFFVSNQKPEYAGAPQKKFAWSLGLGLASIMFVLVVILNISGPISFYICMTCLTLLFLETSFGICVGCKLYNLFNEEKAKLCPGGACEIIRKEEIQKINKEQIFVVFCFIVLIFLIHFFGLL